LTLTCCALGITGACIWPQPVNEEPPPTESDSAPSVQFTPLPASSYITLSADCSAVVTQLNVLSPLSLPLTARLYINFPAHPDSPIHLANQIDIPLQAANGSLEIQTLTPQPLAIDMTTTEVLNLLQPGFPNVLWIWISDGFEAGQLSPTPAVGRYSTPWAWALDFSRCNPLTQ
jgi:hypothetical protein